MPTSAGDMRDHPAPRRPWGSLTRAQIVTVALSIAREEGLDALTVRRLAAELGASRMALYRHVPDKGALLDMVMNAIAEHDVLPPDVDDGPWADRLRAVAHGIRRQLLVYPGVADVLMVRANRGPGGLRLVDTILSVLAEAGLGERDVTRYYLVFIDIVLGRVQRELHGDPVTWDRNADMIDAVNEWAGFERVRAAGPHLRSIEPDEIFELELGMVIDAIAARVAAS